MDLYELFNAKILAAYWETVYSNSIPYLGEGLFPAKRNRGLKLDWIVGYDKLPVALMPAAFDAKPVLRDRGGIETKSTRMPFFREAMRIGEEDRQELLTLMAGNSPFVDQVIERLFDDASTLIDGAVVNPEIMRFSLLQTGTITMASPNESGISVNYNYDYDQDGTWKSKNWITLTGTEVWGGADANVVRDILAIKRQAAAQGKILTRAVVSPATWAIMLTDPAIGHDIFPLSSSAALSDSDLQTYLVRKTGITFTVYEKMYTGLDGVEKPFMNDDSVVFLPSSVVGSTYYGTTPEEADLMISNSPADVRIVNGGISVLSMLEALPVNVITSVSEIVLPSFEGMNSVFVLKIS
jgi:hypothetical protein